MENNNEFNKVTSRDVALLAGVSQSTVSRVFSANPNLSIETRRKVMEAAKMLNYQPNAFARSLVLSRSNFIGIVKGYTRNTAFAEMLSEIVYLIQRSNRQIIYFESEKNQSIDDMMTQILQYQIEGLILLYANLSSELTLSCQRLNIPVLQVLRYSTSVKTNVVLPNNYKAAEDAAVLLIEKGFRNFVYLAGDINSSSNMERQFGFFRKLHEYGYPDPIILQGDYTYESGMAAVRASAKKMPLPCAILCANDLMAFGAIDALKYEFGLTIGKDVAIIGFDNIFMGEWPAYSLTSFSQPISLMAKDAVDLLFQNIQDKNMVPVERRYPLQLIERNSTKTD